MKIKILKLCGYLVVFSMLAGCATTPGSGTKKTASSVVNVIEYISLKLDMGQQSVIKKGNITVTVNPIAPASPKRKICEKRGPEYKDGPFSERFYTRFRPARRFVRPLDFRR